VGLFEITDMGQLTSAQIKNAHRILNVIAGTLTVFALITIALALSSSPSRLWYAQGY
jgi:hypothetical protein